jgi:hypothetical protein
VSRALRVIAAPFVAAGPAGARVRTRLRVTPEDAAVLREAGRRLGTLAGRDLAARCAEGRLDAKGRAASRAARKRALTAESSSRWAGAITRTSEDAWQLAFRNLAAERATLKARVRKVEARLAVPAGGKRGRLAGYATPAERHGKTLRLKALKGRLARVERQAEAGAVSVTRGGRRLMRARLNLADAGLTEAGGGSGGKRSGCSSPLTARRTRRGAMRRSAGTLTRAGWRSSCPPRSRAWRTGRTAAAGSPARSSSPTEATR